MFSCYCRFLYSGTNMTSGHGCPINHDGPTLPGVGNTDYERYLRVDELLSLQKDAAELSHPDEMMFMCVHQSFEIWLKLVRFELDRIKALLDAGHLYTAVRLLRRCRNVLGANKMALRVFDTMAPNDFHEVRRQLGNGSGAESPGFRQIQREAPTVWPHVEALLEREGETLEPIYLKAGHRSDLFALLEAMTDFDQEFSSWRAVHLGVVKRIIGRDVKSLKGYAVHQLEEDIQQNLWPALWKVREAVTMAEGTSPE
jgi:tryptophan 2,3-dioxygenase